MSDKITDVNGNPIDMIKYQAIDDITDLSLKTNKLIALLKLNTIIDPQESYELEIGSIDTEYEVINLCENIRAECEKHYYGLFDALKSTDILSMVK